MGGYILHPMGRPMSTRLRRMRGPMWRGLVSARPPRGQTPTSPPADPSSVSRGTPSTTTPLALLAQKLRLPSLLLLHVDLLAPNYLGASVFVVGALAPLTRAARLWVLSFALFPFVKV